MKSFRKAIAIIIFTVIGFPLCMAALSAVSMKSWLQDGRPWKELVRNERFAAVLKSQEPASFAPDQITLGETSLKGKALVSSVLKEVDPALLASTAESAVDAVFGFAQGKTEGTVPMLDLAAVKKELALKADTVAREYLALAGTQGAPDKTVKAAGADLRKFISKIPDSLPLLPQGSEISLSSHMKTSMNRSLTYLIIAASGILLACAFIGESSWKKRSVFLGATLMVPSMIILVMGFLPYLISPAGMLKSAMQNPLASYPLTLDYVRFALGSLTAGFRISGSIAVAAAVLLLSARFLHTANEDSEA